GLFRLAYDDAAIDDGPDVDLHVVFAGPMHDRFGHLQERPRRSRQVGERQDRYVDVGRQALVGDLVEGVEPLGLLWTLPRRSGDLVLLSAPLAAEPRPEVLQTVERRPGAQIA